MIPFPHPTRPNPARVQKNWLLLPGAILISLAGLFWLSGGYQVGFHLINAWGERLPAAFWTHVTLLGDTRVAVALALPFALRNRRFAWQVMLALLIGGVGVHLLKAGFSMPRPPAVLEPGSFNLPGAGLRQGSFPSGHSLTAFAAAGLGLAWLPGRRWRWILLLLATLAALSRTMVGVHWPVDLLAGAGLGLWVAWIAVRLGNRWPLGEKPGLHAAFCLLMAGTAVSLVGYTDRFPQNLYAGTTLAVLVTLLSVWAWLDHRRAS